jgi:hypothetical protein
MLDRLSAGDWRRVISENPDISYKIVSDIVKCVQSADTPNRTGRRPSPEAMSFDELMQTLFPEKFSTQPFNVACRSLVGAKTQQEFADAANLSQSHLCRLLSGERTPDQKTMEAIARAAGVSPSYFIEYRATALAEALTDFLIQQPQESLSAIKTMVRYA